MIRIFDNQQGKLTLVAAEDSREPHEEKQKEIFNTFPELQLLEVSSQPPLIKGWSIAHRFNRFKKIRRPSSRKSS